ncbi:LysE family translocator [Marinobacter sp. ELB17]|uniref:LysE family translocator n=1 Tax=Marinobacter sp. ELB17 TaxID=270374 RepID=UPI0000F36CDF|nr:LysE family translocator [Marinobacter sp. ELB17]EBA01317.1 putative amino acid efflux protein, LysE family [Marinobacter sp. ELB17]
MFDYTLAHWSTFFIAAILLNLSPGPDIAYILAQTARNGQRSGFAAMFGIWSGAFLHVLLAAVGLSAILATSATAFTFVKWVGAIYLIWLGIQAFRSNGASYSSDRETTQSSNLKIFRQGVLVSALNPKVAIFFLAFLPQFIVVGAGPTSAQLFLHGTLIIVVAAFIEPPLVILGSKLTRYLSENPKVASWMDRGLGTLFVGLGTRLALSDRT